MRKLLIAITVLLLLLSGCGKKEEAYSVELVGQMVQSEVFSEELEELDGDIAFSLRSGGPGAGAGGPDCLCGTALRRSYL